MEKAGVGAGKKTPKKKKNSLMTPVVILFVGDGACLMTSPTCAWD